MLDLNQATAAFVSWHPRVGARLKVSREGTLQHPDHALGTLTQLREYGRIGGTDAPARQFTIEDHAGAGGPPVVAVDETLGNCYIPKRTPFF